MAIVTMIADLHQNKVSKFGTAIGSLSLQPRRDFLPSSSTLAPSSRLRKLYLKALKWPNDGDLNDLTRNF